MDTGSGEDYSMCVPTNDGATSGATMHGTRPLADPGASALMLQFLAWIAERPRPRAEVLEAWRSTCPRLSIWEDATIAGYVRFEDRLVTITPRGRAMLETADVAAIGRDRADALADALSR
jgi:hypothetical protein